MSDLISRAAAIDALAEQMPKPYTPDGSHPADEGIFAAQEIYADCIQTLEALPSAQPERKKGCWIAVDSYTAFGGDEILWMSHGNPIALHYCSECKNDAYAGEDGEDLLTDFCPNCGADMRGEPNDE